MKSFHEFVEDVLDQEDSSHEIEPTLHLKTAQTTSEKWAAPRTRDKEFCWLPDTPLPEHPLRRGCSLQGSWIGS